MPETVFLEGMVEGIIIIVFSGNDQHIENINDLAKDECSP